MLDQTELKAALALICWSCSRVQLCRLTHNELSRSVSFVSDLQSPPVPAFMITTAKIVSGDFHDRVS